VQGTGFKVQDSWLRGWGLGPSTQGSGFKV
jgi:hypothetical protein